MAFTIKYILKAFVLQSWEAETPKLIIILK